MHIKKIPVSIYIVIFLEILLIIEITHALYKKHSSVLGVSSMKIEKNTIDKKPSATLAHFYEWKPNQRLTHERTWLPQIIQGTTNADCLIANTEYATIPPDNTYRILALGDSFTESPFVIHEDTYPQVLENLLNQQTTKNRYEVLNFGVGGYDIEYAAQRFITRGQKYKPNLIVWFLKDDDFEVILDLMLTREYYYKQALTEEQKDNLSSWEKFSSLPKELQDDLQLSLEDKIAYISRVETMREIGEKEAFDRQTLAIERVRSVTDAPILLITFNFTQPIYKNRMQYWAKTIPNVLYSDAIRDIYEANASFRPYDNHPNTKGYEMIAEDIHKFLLLMKVISN